MPKIDDVCTEAGTYHCTKHPDWEVEMPLGHKFPPCPHVHEDVEYKKVS